MNTKTTKYHSILVCVLSIFVKLSTAQLAGLNCTDGDTNKLFVCVAPLLSEFQASCDVECNVLQDFIDCANSKEVTADCVDSVDDAIGVLAEFVRCDVSVANSIIARCFPNGLDAVIIKPVWTEKEVSTCSVSCGDGTQTWTRKCVSNKDPSVTRSGCSGDSSGTQGCQVDCIQPDGIVWTEWSDYSECSVTCGEGNKARQRQCVNETHPAVLVEGCLGLATETESCILDKCKSSDGITARVCPVLSLLVPMVAGVLYWAVI